MTCRRCNEWGDQYMVLGDDQARVCVDCLTLATDSAESKASLQRAKLDLLASQYLSAVDQALQELDLAEEEHS